MQWCGEVEIGAMKMEGWLSNDRSWTKGGYSSRVMKRGSRYGVIRLKHCDKIRDVGGHNGGGR